LARRTNQPTRPSGEIDCDSGARKGGKTDSSKAHLLKTTVYPHGFWAVLQKHPLVLAQIDG
jgi:hypothetical protein